MRYSASRLIARLVTSRFVRNVAVVATGTAAAQVITMIFAPIITRLYGPEAFGVMGSFAALLTVLTPLAALSYPIAIVLPINDANGVSLVRLSFVIGVASSLLTALIVMQFHGWVGDVLGLPSIEPFMFLIPVAMLLSVCMAIASQWVIRTRRFRISATAAVIHALVVNVVLVGVGVVLPDASVLVVVAALGAGVHALILYAGIRSAGEAQNPVGQEPNEETELSLSETAWKYRDFAVYRTPQIVLNSASQGVPILMLASFFGPAAAGFYSLGRMVLGIPTTLIGQSVASVFYPRINDAVNAHEDAYKLIQTATIALALVGLFPFGVIVAFGPWIFSIVFGSSWEVAGVYSQWLALWLYVAFINRPSVGAIPVLGLQGPFLAYEIASVGLRVTSLAIGFYVFKSDVVAVAAFSLVGVTLNGILIALTLVAAKRVSANGVGV